METNDQSAEAVETQVDKTTENNDSKERFETVDAQRRHWKEQAIDPETGKKYKDLIAELKDAKSESKSDKTAKNDSSLSNESSQLQERFERLALKSAEITHEDDVALAKETAAKWGMDIESLVEDPDFQAKLQRQQTERSNIEATSNVKGDKGGTSAKDTPEYWIAKGVPPSRDEVPDRKTRAKIARAMLSSTKSTSKFYNE